MRRLSRGTAALACLLAVVTSQLAFPVTPARAAAGDLATTAGGVGGNGQPATSIAIGARGLALYESSTAAPSILYVADLFAHAVRAINLTTGIATVFAGMGANNNSGDNGPATAAGINTPADVALDANNDVVIAAQLNARIRKVTLSDGIIRTQFSGLNNPQGVAFNAAGDEFVADTYNGQVLKSTSGGPLAAFATGLNRPSNIAFDSSGNVYVSDCQNHVVYRYTAAGGSRTVVAGLGTNVSGAAVDGVAATASGLNCPRGLVVDASNVIYVADAGNNRVRQFTVGGTITTVAGTGVAGMSGDGAAATAATLDHPTDLVEDSTGRFYVAQGGDQASDAGKQNWGCAASPWAARSRRSAATGGGRAVATAVRPPRPSSTTRAGWPSIRPARCTSPTRATTWSARWPPASSPPSRAPAWLAAHRPTAGSRPAAISPTRRTSRWTPAGSSTSPTPATTGSAGWPAV
ncbi:MULTISPECIES: hypothetical protein [unclassified Actinoplanes]|uniref:hypothetical protein n=1 Tax=unclassified Actinoplanes TaxID=2626549 RepID=UPI000318435B|nr:MULTISPECIES: hypothetical protein [unclassified Actinoplanes]